MRLYLSYIYWFFNSSLLDLNCTVFKDFSDSIRSLFIIIKFAVDASHLQINLIANFVVMCDMPGIFSDIINVYLALLYRGYNYKVYD